MLANILVMYEYKHVWYTTTFPVITCENGKSSSKLLSLSDVKINTTRAKYYDSIQVQAKPAIENTCKLFFMTS